MADAVVAEEIPQNNNNEDVNNMELDSNGDAKRAREEETNNGSSESEAAAKKQKVDKLVEEERLDDAAVKENEGEGEEEKEAEEEKKGPVSLGPKSFDASVDMFNYFHKFVHYWPMNIEVNKYEHMILLDLLKKGHTEPEKKIGSGVRAFQVRSHPMWKNRCFFIVREDESVEDFSFRKCVDCILPLPEEMKGNPNANKALGGRGGSHGGRGGGGRRGGGRGRGRGRGFRN